MRGGAGSLHDDPFKFLAQIYTHSEHAAPAYFSYLGEGGAPLQAGSVLRADPVHFYADRDRLHAVATAVSLDITLEENASILHTIREHFNDRGWMIQQFHAPHWYVVTPNEVRMHCATLAQLRRADVMQALPQGPDGAYWRSVVNELQMLLNDHPVNVQRQAQGKLAINSFWLWGAGQITSAEPLAWTMIVGDGDYLQGMARFGQMELTPLRQYRLPDRQVDECIFIADLNLMRAATTANYADWRQIFAVLDEQLFGVLQTSARSGRPIQLEVHTMQEKFILPHKKWRFWWKFPLRLTELCP